MISSPVMKEKKTFFILAWTTTSFGPGDTKMMCGSGNLNSHSLTEYKHPTKDSGSEATLSRNLKSWNLDASNERPPTRTAMPELAFWRVSRGS